MEMERMTNDSVAKDKKKFCIFCQKVRPSEPCKSATEKSFATFQESTKNRKLVIDTKYGALLNHYLSLSIDNVQFHRSCYSDFTNKTLILRLKKHSESRPISRASNTSTAPFTKVMDWSLCVMCQNSDANKDHLRKVTPNVASQIENLAKSDSELFARIRDTNLETAALIDGLCIIAFERRHKKMNNTTQKKQTAFNDLCAEVRASGDRKVLKLEDLWTRFTELCEQNNEDIPPSFQSRRSTFKQKLSESVSDLFFFYQPTNRDIYERQMVLIPTKRLYELCLSENEPMIAPSKNYSPASTESDIMGIVHTGLLIRKNLSEHQGYSGLNVSKELAQSVVPENLNLLLCVIAKGQEAVDEFFNKKSSGVTDDGDNGYKNGGENDSDDSDDDTEDEEDTAEEDEAKSKSKEERIQNFSNRILSIAQDIVYVCSKGKKRTPKHIGLALAIHQKTRSRKLVSLFSKAGHCVPYREVLQIDRSLAELTLDSLDYSSGAVIPPNILNCDAATKIFEDAEAPFVPVLHVTADNIDLLTDTIDGKNTFHATQMVVFQRGGKSSDESLNITLVKKGSSKLKIPEILNFLPENQLIEEEPKFNTTVKLGWYDDNDTTDIKEARTKDLYFLYSRQDKPDAQKIGWTQFNKSISTNNLPVTASGFMPLILNPAHEFNTLVTVATRCIAVADKLNYPYVVLTVDQALHCKLLDVKWSLPIFQERIVLMMGGFHIACNYLKAIGQHMANTGLAEMWVKSGILAEGSSIKVLNGKAYAKAMRVHKLTFQALWRIILPRFVEFLKTDYPEIYERIAKMDDDVKLSMILWESSEIEEHLQIFLKKESAKNVNISLWLTYMESVWILLMFTRSVRDGIWKLYRSSLKKMLPLLARYDHLNYLKSLTVFIAEMEQLPSIIKTAFENGDFVVKKTDAKFNHVAADHAQEWLVGTSKDAGGIVGVTNKQATLQRWALSFHWRTDITNKTFCMYGLTPKINKHIEENPGRRKRDINDENTILKFLHQLKILSPDANSDHIQNAATKDVATNEIEVSLLKAYEEGRKTAIEFVKTRLISQEDSATTVSYNQRMSKVNARTMADLLKPPSTVSSVKKIKEADSNFLQRLTMSFEAGRQIDLRSILRHELHKFPLSLADVNGNLRKGDETALTNVLCKFGHCVNALPPEASNSQLIINGSEMMKNIQKPSTLKTFGDFRSYFVAEVKKMSWNYRRADVLFDCNNEHWVQTNNFQKRTKLLAPIRRIIDNENVPLPQNMSSFLSLAANQADLSNFVCEKLAEIRDNNSTVFVVSGGFFDKTKVASSDPRFNPFPLVSNQDYAKTRMVMHAINSEAENIVVISKDAEVLFLMIHHYDKMRCKQLWIQMGSSKRRLYVPVHSIYEKLANDMRKNILAYHFLTGSDFTSYLPGIGKAAGWKVFEINGHLLSSLGGPTLTSEVMASIEEFFVKLYKVDGDVKTADLARYFLFGKLKSLNDLPPTTDALRFHIYRSHLQTNIFKNCYLTDLPLEDPAQHGWRLNENNQFEPILSSLEAMPSSCENMISCGCPEDHCSNNRCVCHKNGLRCMAMCKCAAICKNSIVKQQL